MLTMEEILETSCDAVLSANKEYSEMSGGRNLQQSGIEAFVSSSIARALWQQGLEKDGGAHCVLEGGPQFVRESSGAEGTTGPLPKAMRQNGRIDIVYLNKLKKPIGLIEVKRHFGWSQMESDLKRLRWLLKRCGPEKNGSVRWGVVVGFHVNWEGSRKDLNTKLDDFKSNFSKSFKDVTTRSYIAPQNKLDTDLLAKTQDGFSSAGVLFRMKA